MTRQPRRRIPLRVLTTLSAMALVGAAACGSGVPDDVIDRETFIETYVDLRITALDTDSQRIGDADREAVLNRHGVTVDDLTRFADVHAEELEFMRDVWNEVELRLDRDPGVN